MGELDDVARHAEHVPLGVPALARRADGRAASVHRPAARLHLLRDYYDVPYPLAHHQPFVSGRQLVYEAQGGSGLAPEFCLVAAVSGQYVLTPASESYLTRGDVGRWYRDSLTSDDDPASPVRVDPDVRFGRPVVCGISTEILWAQSESGADVRKLSEAFDLGVGDVQNPGLVQSGCALALRSVRELDASGVSSSHYPTGVEFMDSRGVLEGFGRWPTSTPAERREPVREAQVRF